MSDAPAITKESLSKYFKMIQRGLPLIAIQQRMKVVDNLTDDYFAAFVWYAEQDGVDVSMVKDAVKHKTRQSVTSSSTAAAEAPAQQAHAATTGPEMMARDDIKALLAGSGDASSTVEEALTWFATGVSILICRRHLARNGVPEHVKSAFEDLTRAISDERNAAKGTKSVARGSAPKATAVARAVASEHAVHIKPKTYSKASLTDQTASSSSWRMSAETLLRELTGEQLPVDRRKSILNDAVLAAAAAYEHWAMTANLLSDALSSCSSQSKGCAALKSCHRVSSSLSALLRLRSAKDSDTTEEVVARFIAMEFASLSCGEVLALPLIMPAKSSSGAVLAAGVSKMPFPASVVLFIERLGPEAESEAQTDGESAVSGAAAASCDAPVAVSIAVGGGSGSAFVPGSALPSGRVSRVSPWCLGITRLQRVVAPATVLELAHLVTGNPSTSPTRQLFEAVLPVMLDDQVIPLHASLGASGAEGLAVVLPSRAGESSAAVLLWIGLVQGLCRQSMDESEWEKLDAACKSHLASAATHAEPISMMAQHCVQPTGHRVASQAYTIAALAQALDTTVMMQQHDSEEQAAAEDGSSLHPSADQSAAAADSTSLLAVVQLEGAVSRAAIAVERCGVEAHSAEDSTRADGGSIRSAIGAATGLISDLSRAFGTHSSEAAFNALEMAPDSLAPVRNISPSLAGRVLGACKRGCTVLAQLSAMITCDRPLQTVRAIGCGAMMAIAFAAVSTASTSKSETGSDPLGIAELQSVIADAKHTWRWESLGGLAAALELSALPALSADMAALRLTVVLEDARQAAATAEADAAGTAAASPDVYEAESGVILRWWRLLGVVTGDATPAMCLRLQCLIDPATSIPSDAVERAQAGAALLVTTDPACLAMSMLRDISFVAAASLQPLKADSWNPARCLGEMSGHFSEKQQAILLANPFSIQWHGNVACQLSWQLAGSGSSLHIQAKNAIFCPSGSDSVAFWTRRARSEATAQGVLRLGYGDHWLGTTAGVSDVQRFKCPTMPPPEDESALMHVAAMPQFGKQLAPREVKQLVAAGLYPLLRAGVAARLFQERSSLLVQPTLRRVFAAQVLEPGPLGMPSLLSGSIEEAMVPLPDGIKLSVKENKPHQLGTTLPLLEGAFTHDMLSQEASSGVSTCSMVCDALESFAETCAGASAATPLGRGLLFCARMIAVVAASRPRRIMVVAESEPHASSASGPSVSGDDATWSDGAHVLGACERIYELVEELYEAEQASVDADHEIASSVILDAAMGLHRSAVASVLVSLQAEYRGSVDAKIIQAALCASVQATKAVMHLSRDALEACPRLLDFDAAGGALPFAVEGCSRAEAWPVVAEWLSRGCSGDRERDSVLNTAARASGMIGEHEDGAEWTPASDTDAAAATHGVLSPVPVVWDCHTSNGDHLLMDITTMTIRTADGSVQSSLPLRTAAQPGVASPLRSLGIDPQTASATAVSPPVDTAAAFTSRDGEALRQAMRAASLQLPVPLDRWEAAKAADAQTLRPLSMRLVSSTWRWDASAVSYEVRRPPVSVRVSRPDGGHVWVQDLPADKGVSAAEVGAAAIAQAQASDEWTEVWSTTTTEADSAAGAAESILASSSPALAALPPDIASLVLGAASMALPEAVITHAWKRDDCSSGDGAEAKAAAMVEPASDCHWSVLLHTSVEAWPALYCSITRNMCVVSVPVHNPLVYGTKSFLLLPVLSSDAALAWTAHATASELGSASLPQPTVPHQAMMSAVGGIHTLPQWLLRAAAHPTRVAKISTRFNLHQADEDGDDAEVQDLHAIAVPDWAMLCLLPPVLCAGRQFWAIAGADSGSWKLVQLTSDGTAVDSEAVQVEIPAGTSFSTMSSARVTRNRLRLLSIQDALHHCGDSEPVLAEGLRAVAACAGAGGCLVWAESDTGLAVCIEAPALDITLKPTMVQAQKAWATEEGSKWRVCGRPGSSVGADQWVSQLPSHKAFAHAIAVEASAGPGVGRRQLWMHPSGAVLRGVHTGPAAIVPAALTPVASRLAAAKTHGKPSVMDRFRPPERLSPMDQANSALSAPVPRGTIIALQFSLAETEIAAGSVSAACVAAALLGAAGDWASALSLAPQCHSDTAQAADAATATLKDLDALLHPSLHPSASSAALRLALADAVCGFLERPLPDGWSLAADMAAYLDGYALDAGAHLAKPALKRLCTSCLALPSSSPPAVWCDPTLAPPSDVLFTRCTAVIASLESEADASAAVIVPWHAGGGMRRLAGLALGLLRGREARTKPWTTSPSLAFQRDAIVKGLTGMRAASASIHSHVDVFVDIYDAVRGNKTWQDCEARVNKSRQGAGAVARPGGAAARPGGAAARPGGAAARPGGAAARPGGAAARPGGRAAARPGGRAARPGGAAARPGGRAVARPGGAAARPGGAAARPGGAAARPGRAAQGVSQAVQRDAWWDMTHTEAEAFKVWTQIATRAAYVRSSIAQNSSTYDEMSAAIMAAVLCCPGVAAAIPDLPLTKSMGPGTGKSGRFGLESQVVAGGRVGKWVRNMIRAIVPVLEAWELSFPVADAADGQQGEAASTATPAAAQARRVEDSAISSIGILPRLNTSDLKVSPAFSSAKQPCATASIHVAAARLTELLGSEANISLLTNPLYCVQPHSLVAKEDGTTANEKLEALSEWMIDVPAAVSRRFEGTEAWKRMQGDIPALKEAQAEQARIKTALPACIAAIKQVKGGDLSPEASATAIAEAGGVIDACSDLIRVADESSRRLRDMLPARPGLFLASAAHSPEAASTTSDKDAVTASVCAMLEAQRVLAQGASQQAQAVVHAAQAATAATAGADEEASFTEAVGTLAITLTTCRPHAVTHVSDTVSVNPAWLLLESALGIVARPRQVDIVTAMTAAIDQGVAAATSSESAKGDSVTGSRVDQGRCGLGKSSCISPLVAGHAASQANRLSVVTVPRSLVDAAAASLRRVLSAPSAGRRVLSLSITRASVGTARSCAMLHRILADASSCGDIVATTPQSLRSLLLRAVEARGMTTALDGATDVPEAIRTAAQSRSEASIEEYSNQRAMATDLEGCMTLLRQGCCLHDEVHLALSPLRSELNFTLGKREEQPMWRERAAALRIVVGAFFDAAAANSASPARSSSSCLTREETEAVLSVFRQGVADRAIVTRPEACIVDRDAIWPLLCTPIAAALARWTANQLADPWRWVESVGPSSMSVVADSQFTPPETTNSEEVLAAASEAVSSGVANEFRDIAGTGGAAQHAPDLVLRDDSRFWCSKEYPSRSTLTLSLAEPKRVCGMRIRFRPTSQFVMRSGIPMLPAMTQVELVAESSSTKSSQDVTATIAQCESGSILWDAPAEPSKHVRLHMTGAARWFAIESIELFSALDQGHTEHSFGVGALLPIITDPSESAVASLRLLPVAAASVVSVARDSLLVFAPHALCKRLGVHFGLLPDTADSNTPGSGSTDRESAARRLLAVPYAGRGVPSVSSEFASPDAALAATLSAYAQSGLRLSDCRRLLAELRRRLSSESGPLPHRPVYRLFTAWATASPVKVLPLHLLSDAEPADVASLHSAMASMEEVVRWYLDEVALPQALRVRRYRLTATGEDIACETSGIARLGFSGTPSSRLPRGMGECHFEPASEALVAATLTDPDKCRLLALPDGWTTEQLLVSAGVAVAADGSGLTGIAAASPSYRALDVGMQALCEQLCGIRGIRALIDHGALVAGCSNQQAAVKVTLAAREASDSPDTGVTHSVHIGRGGESWASDVSKSDGSASGGDASVVRLADCGVAATNRFTLYDQSHCTGCDVSQAPAACALLTLSKDSTLTEVTQAAWRMRKIEQGQSLVLLAPPEVMALVASSASASASDASSASASAATAAAAAAAAAATAAGPVVSGTSVGVLEVFTWLCDKQARAEAVESARLRGLRIRTLKRQPALTRALSSTTRGQEASAAFVELMPSFEMATRTDPMHLLKDLLEDQPSAFVSELSKHAATPAMWQARVSLLKTALQAKPLLQEQWQWDEVTGQLVGAGHDEPGLPSASADNEDGASGALDTEAEAERDQEQEAAVQVSLDDAWPSRIAFSGKQPSRISWQLGQAWAGLDTAAKARAEEPWRHDIASLSGLAPGESEAKIIIPPGRAMTATNHTPMVFGDSKRLRPVLMVLVTCTLGSKPQQFTALSLAEAASIKWLLTHVSYAAELPVSVCSMHLLVKQRDLDPESASTAEEDEALAALGLIGGEVWPDGSRLHAAASRIMSRLPDASGRLLWQSLWDAHAHEGEEAPHAAKTMLQGSE